MPQHALAEQIVLLRLAVCVLGGPQGSGWWRCGFLSESGVDVAAYNFPRKPLAAAFRASVKVAKRLHDDRIGKRGIAHLFRFPVDFENSLHTGAGARLEEIVAIPAPKHAMEDLER